MKDGLYIVDRGNIYAAFVVNHGEVTTCAPVLRRNLDYFKKIARRIETDDEEEDQPPPWRLPE
jgi:hypothetical protein